jgi:hypothetical protein
MTDLQVKYQTLQHEKEKLAEDKRLHDAQISELGARGAKESAEVDKLLIEAKISKKDLDWYDVHALDEHGKAVAYQVNAYETGAAKLIDAVIPF